jgi:hypothetical protein
MLVRDAAEECVIQPTIVMYICAGEENNEVLLEGRENGEKEKGRKKGQRKIKKKKSNEPRLIGQP